MTSERFREVSEVSRGAATISRRKFLVGLSLLTLLPACGSSDEQQGGGNGSTTIRFLNVENDPNTVDYIDQAAAEYKESHGVEVVQEVVPLDDLYQKLTTSIQRRDPYEMFSDGFIGHIALLQQAGHLEPLTDLVEQNGGRDDFGPNILFPLEGEIWWYPYDYNLAFLYVRKDWLAEKGLEAPRTWEEWTNVSSALTEGDRYGLALPMGTNTATNWCTTTPFWANDVKIFDNQWNIVFDSPENRPGAIESLELIKELHQYMPAGMEEASYEEMLSLFATGQVAMAPYSGRMVHYLEENAPDLTDKFEVIGYPTPSGDRPAVTFGYDGWAVLKGPNSSETKAFLDWFIKNKMVGYLHTVGIHYFPTQTSIYEDPDWRSGQLVEKYWEEAMEPQRRLLLNAKMNSVDTAGPEMDPRPGDIFQEYVFPEMIQKVVLNDLPPADAVDEAAQQMRNVIS